MSDRKTAAELRHMAPSGTAARWTELVLHLAAVEEEREAATGTATVSRDAFDNMVSARDAAWDAAQSADAFSWQMARRAGDAELLAADALRIGLEECERLIALALDQLLARVVANARRLRVPPHVPVLPDLLPLALERGQLGAEAVVRQVAGILTAPKHRPQALVSLHDFPREPLGQRARLHPFFLHRVTWTTRPCS